MSAAYINPSWSAEAHRRAAGQEAGHRDASHGEVLDAIEEAGDEVLVFLRDYLSEAIQPQPRPTLRSSIQVYGIPEVARHWSDLWGYLRERWGFLARVNELTEDEYRQAFRVVNRLCVTMDHERDCRQHECAAEEKASIKVENGGGDADPRVEMWSRFVAGMVIEAESEEEPLSLQDLDRLRLAMATGLETLEKAKAGRRLEVVAGLEDRR